MAHCWCASSTGAERVLWSFASAGSARRLAGLAALPSGLPSHPTFCFSLPMRERDRQRDEPHSIGAWGRSACCATVQHNAAAGHPDRRPACARPSRAVGDTDRPRQAPLMGLVSLQRNPATLRCSGMPSSRTIPLRCCGWPRPSVRLRSVGAESPRFCPLTPAVFRLTSQAVTFLSVIVRLFAARRGAFAGASLSARRSSPRAAGSRRLAGLFPAALMGFNPSQLCSGRTVPQRLRLRRPT